MMMEKDQDLGLSLSLSSAASSSSSAAARSVPPQLALRRPSSSSTSSPSFHPFPYSSSCHPKPQWSDLLLASHQDKIPMLDMPLLRGIDVNRAPPSAAAGATTERDSEEDGGASSPNSTVSSASGATKRTERDPGGAGAGDDLDVERASSRGPASDEEDGEGSRKKLRLSKDQSAVLEESFKEHNTLNPKQKMALAKQLNLRPRQVEVWFQNRRARTKLKQTEVDCEFLKRCCENLTEENRRLQKEVMELRALKLSPQFYMQMTPPTTLTMCPSCEKVSNSTAAAAAGSGGPSNSSQPASTIPSTSPSPQPEQHHQFLQHHRPVSPAPWAPIPLRPSFLDAPPQRS